MDGLMFDTEPLYKAAWQAAAQDVGYQISDKLFHSLIGKNNTDSENIVIETLGRNFPITKFRELWPNKWRDQVISDGIPIKIGLMELLDFLDSKNIPYGIATSSDQEDAYFPLNRSGITKRFKCIITGDKVQKGKPNPEIYLAAAQKLGVTPNSCLAIEDSISGAKASINAGIKTIIVPDIVKPTEEIISSSYAIVTSLFQAQVVIEELIHK